MAVIPVDHNPKVAFGAYCRPVDAAVDHLKRGLEDRVRGIGAPLGSLIHEGLPELELRIAARGGDTPEPPPHMISHLDYSDDDRARLQEATHLVWSQAPSSSTSLWAGLWSAFLAAQVAADDFDGIVLDPIASRLVPTGERVTPPGDGRIVISQHIRIWSSVGESGLLWMTTTGMPKFGLPNLEVVGQPPNKARITAHLVNATAGRILDAADSAPADLAISDMEVTAADLEAATGKPHGALPNASLAIRVGVTYGRDPGRDEMEPFVRLHPGGIDASSESVARSLSDWLGSTQEPKRASDSKLESARRHAQAALGQLRRQFAAGLEPGDVLFVKSPFPIEPGRHEFMRSVVTGWTGNAITAALANEPVAAKGLHEGAQILIDETDVWDWRLERHDGSISGDFFHDADLDA